MAAPQIAVVPIRPSGTQSHLNISAAAVVKTGPGVVCRICCSGTPSGGALTIADSAAVTGGTPIVSIPDTILATNPVLTLEFPFFAGLAIQALPTGVTAVSVSYI